MDIAELKKQNPWWSSAGWAEQDYDLQKMSRNKYIYDRKEYIPIKKGIHVIYGPRQVGKTTWIKQDILKITKNKKSNSVLYINAEMFRDRFELYDTLSEVLELYTLKYLFIDEIGSVNDWEKAIKILADTGRLQNKKVLLTGSSSLNILKKAERLPGRLSPGRFKYRYYPLSFKEVVMLYRLKLKNPKQALSKIDELNKILFNYFIHGGFITAINHLNLSGSLDEIIFSVYSGWIDGELAKEKRSSETATYFMDSAVNSMTNDINWNSLVKEVSQPTVASYAELLEDMFVISYIEKSVRTITGKPKNKKVYFYDPFLYWLACFRSHKIKFVDKNLLDNTTLGKLAEQALFSNLLQYVDYCTGENNFNVRKYVRFEKNRKGETDFIVKFHDKKWRLESKFGTTKIKPRDNDVYLTRTQISKNTVPLSIFLLFPAESLEMIEKL